jgi:putative spermidine/putrescine transport system substrate-binding protein
MGGFRSLLRKDTAWRRTFGTLLVVGLLIVSGGAVAKEQLRLLAWPGYADPDIALEFEKLTGAQVFVTYVTSDDELWEKIRHNNGADYDLFAANTAELQRYIESGLIQPIDLRRVPNQARQLPRFQKLEAIPGLTGSGKVYAIPYTYSEMGLIYNRRLVAEAPQSMAVMWDAKYRGRVLVHNTSNHNFSLAALLLGMKNPFRLNDKEFSDAAKQLVLLRRNVLTFYGSPEEAVRLFFDNEIAIVFANYGTQQLKALRAAGADVGYVVPREGALAWLDCWAISRGAASKALAEQWINFMLEKKVSDALTERQGLANTVTPFVGSNSKDKIIWLEPLENFTRRHALWDRILSGDGMEKF